MEAVGNFIEYPGEKDVMVEDVFTRSMFDTLVEECKEKSIKWKMTTEQFQKLWEDLSKRKIISGFLKDKQLGEKRLMSMPDRMTSTITTDGGGKTNRPCVTSSSVETFETMEDWFTSWMKWMFNTEFNIKGEKVVPADLLRKIDQSKYPLISNEEEKMSLPLQTVHLAILDAILIHICDSVSEKGEFLEIKKEILDSLVNKKNDTTLAILKSTYADCNIIMLQECTEAFIAKLKEELEGYTIFTPKKLSATGQNSLILVKSQLFYDEAIDYTNDVSKQIALEKIAPGDLLVMGLTEQKSKDKYILCSFHGDTNGLSTLPVLNAVHELHMSKTNHKLIFGLDANTYTKGSKDLQGVKEFMDDVRSKHLTSCWGDEVDSRHSTTCKARTHLQPQLQKATLFKDLKGKADKNPKDFILFGKGDFDHTMCKRDNTGVWKYVEDRMLPTLTFPSDHCLVAVNLTLKKKK